MTMNRRDRESSNNPMPGAFLRPLAFILTALLAAVLLFGRPVTVLSQHHDQSRAFTVEQATAEPTQTIESVYAEAIDWLYVRYGPGIHYPRIGSITKGTSYSVFRRDPQSLWLASDFPQLVCAP